MRRASGPPIAPRTSARSPAAWTRRGSAAGPSSTCVRTGRSFTRGRTGAGADGDEMLVGAQEQPAAGNCRGRQHALADIVAGDDLRRAAAFQHDRIAVLAHEV